MRPTAQKKEKNQYKYSTKRKTFSQYLKLRVSESTNKDENANTKRDGAWIKKGKNKKKLDRANHLQSRSRNR